jgi:alpha-beta hydrolase superfamily lysophospholipase
MKSMLTTFAYALGILALFIVLYGIAMPALGLKTGSEKVTVTPSARDIYDEVSFTSEGLTLEGWWFAAENPRATLLFVHGAGSSRYSPFFNTLGFYENLQANGISVLTFDQRNHGNSSFTDGYLRMGATEYRDVHAASDWLSKHKPSDAPLVVCGLSMGGATAIYAIAKGLAADGLLLFDPMLNTSDALSQGGYVGYGLPPTLFKPMALLAPYFWNLPSGQDDALTIGSKLTLPVHIVQNKDDPITRSLWSEQLAQQNANAELNYVPYIAPEHPCLADKGRWGTHASSYHCHPEWTMNEVERLLERL